MTVMTMTEARAVLPQVLDRVAAGEEVTLTRYGKPVAMIVRPDIVHPRVPAEFATGPGALHGTRRRRAAAGRRIFDAPAMPVDDVLAELDSIRGRHA